MSDEFQNAMDTESGPSRQPYAVVPHDANALPRVPKALRVGKGGTIVLRGSESTADVTITNVADGETLPIRASHVRLTGTTCSDIVALA